ncbi:MAG: glycosyltransferase family 4 protein [Chloroflexi bacterium]|nr:glycosyltransferase family 4 protein [Chloroflexota bacterium]
MSTYKGRVGIIQRVLPRYRASFFDLLAEKCEGGLSVFAGAARSKESIPLAGELEMADWARADNLHLFDGPFYLCWQRGLKKWLENWKPDILVAEANPRYLSTPIAVMWMHKKTRPVIGWGLGSPKRPGELTGLRMKCRQRFLRRFDAMIAYSQRGAAEYRTLGFPAERVFVAPNAVVPRPVGQLPTRSKEPAPQQIVLYVGRLQERKRLDSLIKTCASLPDGLQPTLQIVGDGSAAAALKQLAMNIYPRAEFTGARFGKELDQYFDQADLFVLPGTGGLAIQQAMAHGLPIIAAEGDGSQRDLVQPGNGWLIEPGNGAALKQVLAEALSNPRQLREMGQKSFELVREEFNLENMVNSFVHAMNQVTG